MCLATRMILILMLTLLLAGGASAQENAAAESAAATATTTAATATTTETTTAPATTTTAAGTRDYEAPDTQQTSYETRNQFGAILRQYPPELGQILVLDPTLLTNDEFLAGYPEVARFIAARPEVRRNPRFYLAHFHQPPPRRRGILEEILEGIIVFATVALVAFALAWLVRTIIEQKRWNRLSQTQTDVHTKILERFGSNEELLQYVRSPAGSKFLESSPIPLRQERRVQNAPATRIIWSIQVGLVVVAGALGMLLVSGRFKEEGFFEMGVIAFCVGLGFIASAVISLVLSRRLGMWDQSRGDESMR